MTRILFIAAAASMAFAAPALADEIERSFTHEGVTYNYTVTRDGNAKVLEGTASKGGDFRLVVKNGWVDGYMSNKHVTFRAPRVTAKSTTLAER